MVNGFDPARAEHLSAEERGLVARRHNLLGPSYRLFYERPVHLVRGEGVWLYDGGGQAYLDAYNNVPCVGHCHPRVVSAVARQAATLNTHTRYLDRAILDYAERLLATFPEAIGRVMFTCSGSEAVDLALRVARAFTGRGGVIVTNNAYHGVTAAAAAISPSFGPNVPLGPHVRTVPAPDRSRAAPGTDVGAAFARDVGAAIRDLERHGIPLAAMIVDTILSTDGILPDPPGFLREAAEAVRRAGGLFIADEVQPGFGRLGHGLWGFERHGIVPDMAVMGKPMGNGLPIAAVAMRPDLAETFGRGTRYFNTFGANSVSIAAAAATLDVIADEGLIANAATVGAQLLDGLSALAARHEAIGDVRGAGLFIGVDLVRGRDAMEPDGALALRVVNGLRDKRVLISASGPFGNVLKIRPPLPFGLVHADILLGRLGEVLDAQA